MSTRTWQKIFLGIGVLALAWVLVLVLDIKWPGGEPPPADRQIHTYSLSGSVTKASGDRVIFQVPRTVTASGGAYVLYDERSALIADYTRVFRAGESAPVPAGEIKTGSRIIVYTRSDPGTTREFPANRIEILK